MEKFLHFCNTRNNSLMKTRLYQQLQEKKTRGQKSFAVLIDPDKVDEEKIDQLTRLATAAKADYLFVGGSLVISNHLDKVVQRIKQNCSYPCHPFPRQPFADFGACRRPALFIADIGPQS